MSVSLSVGLRGDAAGRDFTGYVKHPDLLSANPKGLVPTLVVDGEVVVESLDCIRWIDQRRRTAQATLWSVNNEEELLQRCHWVDQELCSPFYTILVSLTWFHSHSSSFQT